MNKLTYKDIVLDLDKKNCYIDKVLINLTKNEYLLLKFLLENRNKVFSRQELLNEIWSSKVSLRTIDTTISRLRKKLGEYKEHIVSRIGFGYSFNE